MKKAFAVLLVLLSIGSVSQVFAAGSGQCQSNGDTAKDGSMCGNRSADARPGGK